MVAIGSIRSSVDRINDKEKGAFQKMLTALGVCSSYHRMAKFRYLGEYIYALKHGHLDLLFESSLLHANLYRKHGTPVDFIPWGTSPDWYSDLKLERDIDVIWFGKGRTRQRSRLLRKIINELSNQGISTYVADNVENPFIYGEQRTHLLNRAKITLNLSPTWYDPGFPFRFHLAAANKSLVISDPFLPHFPIYREGQHYISVPKEDLTPTIIEYLDRDEKRGPIVENAYNLVTRELTLSKSIKTIMDSVERTLHKRID
jgi:hypothetical protein